MDPYAAQTQTQTYHTPSSSQLQPQTQDPYLYHQQQYDPYQQQYDPSQQHYAYYTQIPQPQYDQSQQYHNPIPNHVYPEQVSQQPPPEPDNDPIHPPGVPVENNPNQTAAYQQAYAQPVYQTDPNYYYQQYQQQPQQLSCPTGHQVQPQWQGHPGDYGPPPNVQGGPYGGSGRGGGHGGGSGRGGGRGFRGGGSSFRGRGRITRVKSEPKPQFLAWCELCRVECNTHEVLENHKNGKKHKKNMEIQEELQRLTAKTHETQIAPGIERVEVKLESQTVQQFEERDGNGLKRKTRDDRKSAKPEKKHKEIVPFICELCDVKCESAPAFDNHLKGRRHMFNVERFQEHQAQATLNQVALQALYPALEAALYPVLLQALAHNASTSYGYGGGLDQHALLQLLQPFLPQIGPAFFQHGLAPPLARPPGPPALGPPQGPTPEADENQVDLVNGPEFKTDDDVKLENKTEEDVKPENKTEEEVEPESKAEDEVEPESNAEDEVEPESNAEDEVEPESKTEGQVDLESKTEDEVKPEIKTEEVDPNAVEPTQ